jgi:hypothetical protein
MAAVANNVKSLLAYKASLGENQIFKFFGTADGTHIRKIHPPSDRPKHRKKSGVELRAFAGVRDGD